MPEPHFRKNFRCVIVDSENQGFSLCTGISINVPAGLTRSEAVDFVTGYIAREVSRYAAWEALGFGPTDSGTDFQEIVT